MGEVAEMVLDGTLCQVCGIFLNADGDGFPRTCLSCAAENAKSIAPKVNCPTCGKRVKAVGLEDHQRDAHGSTPSTRNADE